MQKRAPTFMHLATIAAFVLSCFGILLFLWIAFGGPTPLKARSYFVKVPFTEATTLATQSDVRVSGVSVGKVESVELDEDGEHALATLEIENQYAPIAVDTDAILRQKTLLGEAYVELALGTGEPIPDGGELDVGRVSPAVQLDEIFRTFDEPTRIAFQQWMADASLALKGRGADLSATLGLLEPTFADANRVLRILDSQRLAVRQLVRNTGTVFDAISRRQGQLSGLITASNTVFGTTARRNQDLQDTFVVFPTFLRESRQTLDRLREFAVDTDPLVLQLRPAVRELAPTLVDLGRLAPELKAFLVGLRPVIARAPLDLPALRAVLDDELPPVLAELRPFLDNLIPLVQAAGLYRHEITALLGNATAATNARASTSESGSKIRTYLRTLAPLGPDAIASYPRRLKVNRTNPYFQPLGYLDIGRGLASFATGHCGSGITATLDPADAGSFPTDLFARLKLYAFGDRLSSDAIPAPRCRKQGRFEPIGRSGSPTDYLHVFELP